MPHVSTTLICGVTIKKSDKNQIIYLPNKQLDIAEIELIPSSLEAILILKSDGKYIVNFMSNQNTLIDGNEFVFKNTLSTRIIEIKNGKNSMITFKTEGDSSEATYNFNIKYHDHILEN